MQSFSDVRTNRAESPEWDRMQGQVLDSAYEVWELLHTDRSRAIFRATALRRTRASGEDRTGEYFAILEPATAPDAALKLKRYLEASFLRDVNLLRVFQAGRVHAAGKDYIYVVTERADYSLADFQADAQKNSRSIVDELPELTQHLIGGLSHLHAENLVYCALRPESVWRVGGQWKLADYSQLRVAGEPEEHLDSLLQGDVVEIPPESATGEVSPAWDVWTLGLLLQNLARGSAAVGAVKTMAANGNGQSTPAPSSIPEPFAQIVAGALAPNPAKRLSFGEISFKLNSVERKPTRDLATRPTGTPAVVPSAVTTAPAKPPSHYSLINPAAAGTGVVGYALLSREELEARRLAGVPLGDAAALFHGGYEDDEPQPRGSRMLKAFLIAFVIAAIPAAGYYAWTVWGTDIRSSLHMGSDRGNAAQSSADAEPATGPADAPPPPMTTTNPATAFNSASGSTTAAAVLNLLDHWKEAERTHNLDQVMVCYAPTLDRYFTQKNIASDSLRKQKEDEFVRGPDRNGFDIVRLHFLSVTPDRVLVAFDKSIPTGRKRPTISHEQAVLTRFGGQWRISSEGRNVN